MRILNVDYTEINFEKWYQMATDLEFCMLRKLKHAWPSLLEIVFFYNLTPDVLVMKRESNWEAIVARAVRIPYIRHVTSCTQVYYLTVLPSERKRLWKESQWQ
jgi:hypothetical protein